MKILLYIPVKESYTQLWEYYKNDKNILIDISSKFYYSNNFLSFLSTIFKVDCVYCWWWHRSIEEQSLRGFGENGIPLSPDLLFYVSHEEALNISNILEQYKNVKY